MTATPIFTTEMHTGGEPVRIIESGYPAVPEDSILDIRNFVSENLDHLRRMLMHEPRGHSEMYGALLVKTTSNDIDMSVLFLQNYGYSPMCGHATIALARYLADKKAKTDPAKYSNVDELEFNIEVPCGIVKAFCALKSTEKCQKGESWFHSVDAYVAARDLHLTIPDFGSVTVDISYGGAYYVLVPAHHFNIKFGVTSIVEIIQIAAKIKKAANETFQVNHPIHTELSYIYGVIFTDDSNLKDPMKPSTTNICIFEDGQVDRSPCGSGVTARMALMHAKGEVEKGLAIEFISGVNKSQFTGKIIKESKWCELDCVRVKVQGKAFYTGKSEFTVEFDDPLAFGFHVSC